MKEFETITKSQLIESLQGRFQQFTASQADESVNLILETLTNSLAHGHRVEVRGFGSFSLRERQARTGRNPKTGAAVSVDAKRVVHYRASKSFEL